MTISNLAITVWGANLTVKENLIVEGTPTLPGLTDDSMADAKHRHSELSASDGSPNPAVQVDEDGNVGIGTNAPNDALDVVGNIVSRGASFTATMTPNILEFSRAGGTSYIKATSATGRLGLMGGNSASPHMTIWESGNVGIGTDNSEGATKLEVNGALTLQERTSQPSDPAEGHCVIWLSNGTGVGDDGDLMIITQAGGVLYTNTIVDVVP
jgi:hypothetical protein